MLYRCVTHVTGCTSATGPCVDSRKPARRHPPAGTRPPHSRTRAPALRFSQPSTVPELWLCLWDKLTKCVWGAAVSTADRYELGLADSSSAQLGVVSLLLPGHRVTEEGKAQADPALADDPH